MAEKFLVTAKGIEVDEDGSLIGEVRSNINPDLKCFDIQMALFTDEMLNNHKKKRISTAFDEFYWINFYETLNQTKWSFINKPNIIMLGVTDEKIKINFPFDVRDDVVAYSLKDGNITKDIKVDGEVFVSKLGDYYLTYTVKDSLDNEIKLKRKITVRTNEKPKIIGLDNKTIKLGEEFYPLEGVRAIDKEDGDITEYITIEGKVDSARADSYELVYTIIDSDDNIVTESRTITVKADVSEDEELRYAILSSARELIGKPYVFGGNYKPLGGDIGTDKLNCPITIEIWL